ncbi:ankyrin repeat domain-containing protein 6-like [Dysidea avara]|uniref:ankyrin repeat domain-containing protein 6-like n=1 Tax=Dysidea avara TaxID=196820 RepID=UPI003317EF67
MAAHFHKDYFFQVLSNAIIVDGTKAAVMGDMDLVLELIARVYYYEEDNGPSHLLDTKNSFGYNMLHYSVVHKHLPMVELLLNSKADCDCTTDDDGLYTPLHLAIMYYNVFLDPLDISVSHKLLSNPTHLKVIEILLEQGADVNAQNAAGDSALMLACKNNHLDLIKMLAERNQTNIHLTNQDGDTALHVACAKHLKQAIPILLACNASVILKNRSGHTPIFTACN